jgi:hypothetical protein
MNPQEAFLDVLIAAMKDAATERKLSQIQTTISPDGKKAKLVRLIIIPEEMDFVAPKDQPFGTDSKKN